MNKLKSEELTLQIAVDANGILQTVTSGTINRRDNAFGVYQGKVVAIATDNNLNVITTA